jgi:transcriptional regulator with XRE-family HTH domain
VARRKRGDVRPSELARRLQRLRREHELSKTAMVELLKRHGLPKTTFATYSGWEGGAVAPKPVYRQVLETALKEVERELVLAGETDGGRNG